MFFKQYILESSLTSEEIVRRLKAITRTGNINLKRKIRFEGDVKKDQFSIYPTFDYQSMYRFRPEINGTLSNDGNSTTTIRLTCKLSTGIKILLIAGLILNVSVMIYLILVPSVNSFMFNWKIFAVMIPVMTGILLADFYCKVNRSVRILRHKFRSV